MKVLVLSCSTGGGHNSCAQYIKKEFLANNIPCDCQDYMEIIGPKASAIAEKLYLDSTKNNGLIFKGVYKIGELYSKTNMPSPVYGLNKLVKEKLYNFIINNGYDLIIGTHLFPCIALTAIKKEYPIKFINVATDYECIPFWEETNPDLFVIPSRLLIDRFVAKKISRQVILPIGIPIASSFKVKKNLKVKKQILLVSGSMGFGKVKDLVIAIIEEILDYDLVVICGNNKNLQMELEQINNNHLHICGFVDNINEYIATSEIVITKPGGLTTTEVAFLRKPLIHMMPIPGVENYNAAFFEKYGMSLKAESIAKVIQVTKILINNQKLQQDMINNQKKYINDNSAADLVKYVINNF